MSPAEKEKKDIFFMGLALREAARGASKGEVPVGAVIVKDGEVIARACNRTETGNDPTAHAEIIAIRRAAKKTGSWRLNGATIYVTLEPCTMCIGASVLARLDRLVFGCHDPKSGAVGSLYNIADETRLNHEIKVDSGVLEEECSLILKGFFKGLRAKKKYRAGINKT